MLGHIKVFVFFYTAMILGFLLYMHMSYGDDALAYSKLDKSLAKLPLGSGAAILTPKGKLRVITNFHVCIPSMVEKEVRATDEKGNSGSGKVFKLSPKQDLCLVDAPVTLTPLNVAKSGSTLFKDIYTEGYPLGVLTKSKGIVTHHKRYAFTFPVPKGYDCTSPVYDIHTNIFVGCQIVYNNAITTLYSQPGSSGSPVVDANGELVGVMQTYAPGEGGGFIELRDIKEFLVGE